MVPHRLHPAAAASRGALSAACTAELAELIPDRVGFLYQNDGDDTFTEVGRSRGLIDLIRLGSVTSVAWGDYNGDGHLDLYLGKYYFENDFYENRGDGYGQNVFTGNDIQTDRTYSLRAKLLWEPGDTTSIVLSGDYFGREAADPAFVTFSRNSAGQYVPDVIKSLGGDPQRDIYADFDPTLRGRQKGVSLSIDQELGGVNLRSITAYRKTQLGADQDVDFTSADIVRETRDQKVNTFTQELRIASDFDGPLNFLLGGFYFNEDVSQISGLTTGADSRNFFTLLARAATGDPTFTFNTVEAALAPFGVQQNSIFAAGPLTAEDYSMSNEALSVFGTLDFEPIDLDGLHFVTGCCQQLRRPRLDPATGHNLGMLHVEFGKQG